MNLNNSIYVAGHCGLVGFKRYFFGPEYANSFSSF